MAQIPTDITLTQPTVDLGRLPQGGSPVAIPDKTSLEANAGAQIGSTLGNLGGAVEGLGNTLQIKQNEADDYEAKKQFVTFDLSQDQALQSAQRNTTGDPTGFTNTFMQGYDGAARQMLANVPDSQKQQYDYLLTKRAAEYTERAQNFENTAGDTYHLNDVKTQTDGLQTAIAQSPTTQGIQDNIARAASLIGSSRLPPALQQQAKADFASQAAETAIRARTGSATTLDDLTGVRKDILTAPSYGGYDDSQPDFRTTSQGVAASIRNNNPGAMVPGPSAQKYGSTGEETLRNGDKIATFPDAISGAAAHFDLLNTEYSGKTLADAVKTWSGNNNATGYTNQVQQLTGLSPDTVLTPELLADPDVAIPLAESMANHEAGKPYPLNDAEWRTAFNRANNVGAQDTKVAKGDIPDVNPHGASPQTTDNVILADPNIMRSPYRFLTQMQRRTLLNITSVAGRAMANTQIDNDTARIKTTGAPLEVTLPNGSTTTALEQSRPFLTKNEFETKTKQQHYADLQYHILSPLPNMSYDDGMTHIGEFSPPIDAPDYADRVKAGKEGIAAMDKIQAARKKDPALAVEQTPEVQNARDIIKQLTQVPDGTQPGTGATVTAPFTPQTQISAPKAQQLLIDARLEAQRRLGLTDSETSPITKKEATDLIGADFSQLSDQDVSKTLQAASQTADRRYGSYAPQVFKKALSMVSKDKRIKDAIGPIMRKMLNEDDIDDQDLTDAAALSRQAISDQLFAPDQRQDMSIAGGAFAFPPKDGSFAPQSPDQSGWLGATVPADGSFNAARPAKTIEPPPEAVAYLKKNPSTFSAFDSKYGPGAAAAHLRR